MNKSHSLSDAHKRFIVRLFAVYKTPTQVVDAVKEHFDLTLSRQGAAWYDPKVNPKLAPNLRTLFDETRAAYIADVDSIPISHLAHRLALVDVVAQRAATNGNDAMVLQAAEHAAKEMGGAFTNKLRVSGLPSSDFIGDADAEPAKLETAEQAEQYLTGLLAGRVN